MFTPAVGRHETLIRAAADAIGQPLRQRVVVRWRPTAVVLEPSMGVAYGALGIHGRILPLSEVDRR
jgi:hypothetical protein